MFRTVENLCSTTRNQTLYTADGKLIYFGGVTDLLREHDSSDCEGDVEPPDDLRREREGARVSFVPLTQPLQPESSPPLAHCTHVSVDKTHGGVRA